MVLVSLLVLFSIIWLVCLPADKIFKHDRDRVQLQLLNIVTYNPNVVDWDFVLP